MSSDSPNPDGLSETDRSLVRLIQGGDEDAALRLYQRYSDRLFALVRSKTGEWLEAYTEPEDIVQSTFKSVLWRMQAGNYHAPAGSTLWNLLAVIATRKVVKRANYHKAECRTADRSVPLNAINGGIAVDELEDPSESFDVCLRETLELLSPAYREVLTLRIQGYKIIEISEKTKRTKRSVERTLQKMREKLASHLLDEDENNEDEDNESMSN